MLLIRGQHNLRPEHRACVATIGNFDGVHRGHQAVFGALKQRAKAYGLPSLVITFEPQPIEYLCADKAPPRLTRLGEKLALIQQAGIDRVLLLRFNQALAELPAIAFVEQYLVQGLGVKHLYVGDDFHFGRGREGDFVLLQQLGEIHGYQVENLATVADAGERISSTRVRMALQQGDLSAAQRCLGREYSICGRVMQGHQLGRTIGFPTLNIHMARLRSPIHGVFVVRVDGLQEGVLYGVANVGNRPVLENDDRFLLEVYLFDFNREIYGERVTVSFLQRLRDEKKFDSFELMRKQIKLDVQQARQYLLASQEG
jgi:riboflavin kinase/FMN adenylyltransferase